MSLECAHEPEVVEAVLSGRWLHQAGRTGGAARSDGDDALAAHAGGCEICREVIAITTLIHDDHQRSRYDMQVPAAGQVWWRSAIRARMESTEAAIRPMTWMHGITASIAVGVLLAIATVAWPMLAPLGERAWAFAVAFFPDPAVASSLAWGLRQSALLGLLGAALLVLAPLLAIYVALSRE
jgi:hypothetical protein